MENVWIVLKRAKNLESFRFLKWFKLPRLHKKVNVKDDFPLVTNMSSCSIEVLPSANH